MLVGLFVEEPKPLFGFSRKIANDSVPKALEIIISLPVKDNILLRSFMAFAQGLKLFTVLCDSCSIG
jgi:hypothetical protein